VSAVKINVHLMKLLARI